MRVNKCQKMKECFFLAQTRFVLCCKVVSWTENKQSRHIPPCFLPLLISAVMGAPWTSATGSLVAASDTVRGSGGQMHLLSHHTSC